MSDLVTITVRRDDIENALDALGYAHADYCTSSHCVCGDAAERITEAVRLADEAPED